MNIQEILEELKYCKAPFPHQAVNEAVANKELVIPALLKVLEDSKQLPDALNDEDYVGHIFAMYLLAQFREKRAYPLIVEFFSIPDDLVFDSTGDIITEDLNRILASIAHGDNVLIKSLVENEAVNEFIRAGALKTLLTQMVQGELRRDEVVAYFQSLFRGGLKREPSVVWDDLVCHSTDLYPEELMEDIKRAFQENLIDEMWIKLETVEETLSQDKESVLKNLFEDSGNQLIEDVFEEIGSWECFNPPPPPKRQPLKADTPFLKSFFTKPAVAKKIGRNEPCLCGSGKKYKKCCGR
jgi:hypothetical protein